MTEAGWRFALATVVGTSHLRQQTACQDSAACKTLCDRDGNAILVAIVSDGAGSAERGGIGSMLASSALMEAAEGFLTHTNVGNLDETIARSWLDHVGNAISRCADEDGKTSRDYDCTLMSAIIGEETAAFLQVGDGAMVVSEGGDSNWAWVFWPQRGEFANTTFFVTEAQAKDRLYFDRVHRKIEEVALFSDGIEALVLRYATKDVHDPFFEQMFPPVRASAVEGEDLLLSAALAQYLSSELVSQRTDDDKTLVLASRKPRIRKALPEP